MSVRILQLVGVAAVALVFTGCAMEPPKSPAFVATPRAQFFIAGVTKKQAIDEIVAGKLSRGMTIREVNDYGVTVAAPINNSILASIIYGSSYDRTPEARIHYNVVDHEDGVRIYSRAEMVTNPGSGFERSTDVTASIARELQQELWDLRTKIETANGSKALNPLRP
ncbi:MAG: hypothetical protein AB7Q97_27305 [Gammaproteobacteria bacterium]